MKDSKKRILERARLRRSVRAQTFRIQHLETTERMQRDELHTLRQRPDVGKRGFGIHVIGHDAQRRERLLDGEPVFVLRARDLTAPNVIRAWAHSAADAGVDPMKIGTAMQIASEMEGWQVAHGGKVPD